MITGELQRRWADNVLALSDAEGLVARLKQERIDIIAEAHGIRVGGMARGSRGVGTIEVIDSFQLNRLSSKPWIKIRMLKKDGKPAATLTSCYSDWDPA